MIRLLTLALVPLLTGSPSALPALRLQDPTARPGPEHAQLAKLAGDWIVVTRFDFGAAMPAQEFRGEAHARAVLGGRFVQFEETATEFGQPVERLKTWGFNVASGQYESTWRYTGSTAAMQFVGSSRDGGASIAGDAVFEGKQREAQKFTWKLEVKDNDHFTSTLVAPAHGARPAATFTAIYTRAAGK